MSDPETGTGIQSMADIIAAHPVFEGLDRGLIELMAGCARNVHFAHGAYLFRVDDPVDVLYLLRGGDVTLELHMPGRDRLIVETLHPGQVIGVSWLMRPYLWRFDGRAVGEVRATSIDAACLRGKCDDDPALGYRVMQRFMPVIADRLQSTRVRLLDLYAPPADVGHAL